MTSTVATLPFALSFAFNCAPEAVGPVTVKSGAEV